MDKLPLPALLSRTLVAFTIEFDNEAEHRMPHQTTRHGATAGSLHAPWLVSLAMWANCMQWVDDKGVAVRELERRARTGTNLAGMQRWGYIVVASDPAEVRTTRAGRMAQEIWRPLGGIIEGRWRERFGEEAIDQLRARLWAVARQFEEDLPDCLPILGYGLFSRGPSSGRSEDADGPGLPLSALLSRVLLAFAMEFERESDLSLAISADVVRVLDEKGVRVRDLPMLSGVSKEAISMALGVLRKQRVVAEEDRIVRLTTKGLEAKSAYHKLTAAIEERWQMRFGKDAIRGLRESLERLSGGLMRGLEPYPDGWRAKVRKPDTLPHYPMVLHRGGFPDGS